MNFFCTTWTKYNIMIDGTAKASKTYKLEKKTLKFQVHKASRTVRYSLEGHASQQFIVPVPVYILFVYSK